MFNKIIKNILKIKEFKIFLNGVKNI